MRYSHSSLSVVLVSGLALAGCSSPIPDLIKHAPPDEIRVEEVQQDPDKFIGAQVRWGGDIMQVENREQSTLIEVLSRRLSANGKPDPNSSSQGRFKIAIPGFVEPSSFPKDRLITVRGQVGKVTRGKIGSYSYLYPVVAPAGYYLWPEERDYRYRDVYDPFFYPWYPYPYWYRHPYYWY